MLIKISDMKLYKKNKDQVEVLKRTDNKEVVIIKTNSGIIRLMLKFQPLFDIDGNQITDFSVLPKEVKSSIPFGASNGPKVKDSKTASLIAELNDHKTFNHLTKNWK